MIRSVILSAFALLVFAVQSPAATPLKIMPLGDSITNGGSGSGYRGPLYQKLTAANYSFQFVGSRTDNATAALTTSNNSRHEGHSGSFIKTGDATRIGIYDYLPTWINAAQPDIILLHIGTNDAAAYRDPATMKSDLDAVLTRIHGLRPSADVLVAQIIPIRNDYYGT
ncbi:MAG TPA: GDSL-type esterase/lipase family protein, partial [Tepidisphaeraceae bacterium]|nr:GDSL-type esterase/lipase family protein [Tepidisphaeraceae bacterium]